jgi:hypothetical protein
LDDDDEKSKLEALKAEREPSTRLMRKMLGDKVEKVVVNSRLLAWSVSHVGYSAGCSYLP